MNDAIPFSLEMDLLQMGVLPATPLDEVEDPYPPKVPREPEFYMPELDENGEPPF